jgi:hypothetical protein
MVTKIGRVVWYALALVYTHQLYSASIQLQALDTHNRPITQAVRGIPFMLDVVITDYQNDPQNIEIVGLNQFMNHGTSVMSNMRMINGVTTRELRYRTNVSARAEGTYTIGPAQVKDGTATLTSNTVNIKIVTQGAPSEDTPDARLQIVVDKPTITVGEPCTVTMRFFHDASVRLNGMSKPEFQHCKVGELFGPTSAQQHIRGVDYTVLEWRVIVVPEQPGTMTVSPVMAEYAVPLSNGHAHVMQMLNTIMGGATVKRIYSQPLTINVKPLPGDTKVDGIGNYAEFSLSCQQTQARVGEGIVVSTCLRPVSPLDIVHPIALNLPEGLTYYESKKYLKDDTGLGKTIQCWEYIVQASKPGDFIIPPQTYSIYNPATQQYKKLTTHSHKLHIEGVAVSVSQPVMFDTEPADEQQQFVLPLIKHGSLTAHKPYMIPYTWFFLLLLLPTVGVFIVRFLQVRGLWFGTPRYKKRQLFKQAHLQYEQLLAQHNPVPLYDLFTSLLTHHYERDKATLTREFIHEQLRRKNVSTEFLEDWQEFYTALEREAFGTPTHDKEQMRVLFDKAHMWLLFLEEVI